ncbi:MAG: hydrogenase expression/formation protein HypE [Thermoplasmata archaeon]|nr:hydrogenase expression/formation protein HypE [Thermoplasmata archaeon]
MPDKVTMAHGAGGEVMMDLVRRVILSRLGDTLPDRWSSDVPLSALEDSAVVGDIVFTTDAHTVQPLFFHGGDIGSLSVAGTVNDLAVMGAAPVALSLALVLEEGLPMADLERAIDSVARTAREAGVGVVTGDTKVVERGGVAGMVTCTSGFGLRHPLLDPNLEAVAVHREPPRWPTDAGVREGDAIIVSGSIGDHGAAVLTSRRGFGFERSVASDIAPLNHLIARALGAGGVVAMKDPTRGGVANALNEWAGKSGVGIMLDEEAIPVRDEVRAVCDLLGIDPLEVGNEGKVLIAVVPDRAEDVLEAIGGDPHGAMAAIIGRADASFEGVVLETRVGGRRYVDQPRGDPVPRIC